ncbi:MAG: hypothetical protein EX269_01285 [Acidimicrobiales bacterium]|nr:MAG: hypothetical protein EX269_01285 [Acidimicrobiales bacterium]
MSVRRAFVIIASLALAAIGCSSTTEPVNQTVNSVTRSTVEVSELGETSPRTVEVIEPGEFTKLSEPGVGGRITSLAFDPTDPDRLLVGGDMLGIAVTDDLGDSWSGGVGLASWEIGDIMAEPDADGRIWTGSLSGPQASADGGLTWSLSRDGMPPINDNAYSLPIETILLDPTNDSRLLAFSGNQRNWEAPGAYVGDAWQGDGSVWVSENAGQAWQQLGTVVPGGNVRAATFLGGDPSRLAAAVANQGTWFSSDGGITWSQSTAGLPHWNTYDISAHPTNSDLAWVAMGDGPQVDGDFLAGGIWATVDGGNTWEARTDGLDVRGNDTRFNTASFHQVVTAPSQPDTVYTSNIAPGQAAVYRSDDGGVSWRVIADNDTPQPNPYEGALRAFDIAVHPEDADRVAIGSDDAILISIDGGESWFDLTTQEVATGSFVGRGYSGLVSTDIVFDARLPYELVLLGFDGGNFIQTVDGGQTWRRTVQDISAWGGAIEAAYSPVDPDTLYVLLGQFSNFRGIGKTTDGGESFDRLDDGNGLPSIGNVPGGVLGIAALAEGDEDTILAAIGGSLYISRDSGASFTQQLDVGDVRDVAVAGDGATVFVVAGEKLLRSTDAGRTFELTDASGIGLTQLFASSSEPDAMYGVAFRNGLGGAFRFDGTTWSPIFTDWFAHGLAVDPTNPQNLVVVTSEPAYHDISAATGVYFSGDGGASWKVVNDGLPMTRLRTAEFDPHDPDRVVVGTTGRGFYEISFSAALDG